MPVAPNMLGWYNASWPNGPNGDAPVLGQAVMPTYVSPIPDANHEGSKKHSACDECRKRKLKCSGESTGCGRCLKQNILCHYSLQKQMGRPRKRQKSDEEELGPQEDPLLKLFNDKGGFPEQTNAPNPQAFLDFYSLCPKPWQSYITNYTTPPRTSFVTQGPIYEQAGLDDLMDGSSNSPPSDAPPTPENGYAGATASYNTWPDYSTTQLPQIIRPSSESDSFSSANPIPTATPACTCLPNLYLTLSHLSTLPQFPLSPQTVISLETAMRTAKGVLHCRICPKSVATAIQNVMLLATCLSVIADGWSCILKRSPQEVWRAMSNPTPTSLDEWTPAMEFEWRRNTRNAVRRGVYGDPTAPGEKPLCLMDLVTGMENRQKTWHGVSHPHVTGFEQHHGIGILPHRHGADKDVPRTADQIEEDMFCLKVVDNVRNVINLMGLDDTD